MTKRAAPAALFFFKPRLSIVYSGHRGSCMQLQERISKMFFIYPGLP